MHPLFHLKTDDISRFHANYLWLESGICICTKHFYRHRIRLGFKRNLISKPCCRCYHKKQHHNDDDMESVRCHCNSVLNNSSIAAAVQVRSPVIPSDRTAIFPLESSAVITFECSKCPSLRSRYCTPSSMASSRISECPAVTKFQPGISSCS